MDEQHEGDTILHQDAVEEVVRDVLSESGGSVLLFRTTTIDAPDLATFGSIAVQLVPAPGAGFVLIPVTATVLYVPGVVPFDNSTTVGVVYEGDGNGLISNMNIDLSQTDAQFGSVGKESMSLPLAAAENKALTTNPVEGTDLSDGDGSLAVTIGYYLQAVG